MATAPKLHPVGSGLTPELKAFIDGAIVPALVKQWLAQTRRQNSIAPPRDDIDNAPRQLSAEQGVTP